MYTEPNESKYWEFERLGSLLKIPTFQAFLEMEIKMPDGKIIHHHKQRSHSWVRNAYNCMMTQLGACNASDNTYEAGKLSTKTTGGVVKFGAYPIYQYPSTLEAADNRGYRAGAGIAINGIQVGNGTNAESFEDFVLQTLIANGNGAGQLAYAAGEAVAKSYNVITKTYSVVHIRYFNNNSGADIAVNEVAITPGSFYGGDGNPNKILLSRDKLSSTVTVPNTAQLKVTYTISLVYPE